MPPSKQTSTVKKNAMIKALEKSLGVVTLACKEVGIDRLTHYNWMRADQKYKDRVDEIKNLTLDFAESQLHKKIKDGSDTAIIFFLKTQGKKRGYIEKQEIDVRSISTEADELINDVLAQNGLSRP